MKADANDFGGEEGGCRCAAGAEKMRSAGSCANLKSSARVLRVFDCVYLKLRIKHNIEAGKENCNRYCSNKYTPALGHGGLNSEKLRIGRRASG